MSAQTASAYNSAAWTGIDRQRFRAFPHFVLMFVTPWFGIHIGPMMNQHVYGLDISWGRVPPAPLVATHRHYHRWVWVTAEQMQNRP